MKCTSCKHENRDNANFCTKCGTPLILVCLGCHSLAFEGDIYCSVCGMRLPSNETLSISNISKSQSQIDTLIKPSQSSSPQILDNHQSERKTVTVLFADISGFTAMSELLDPEEVTTVMNACLQIMGDTVIAYEGYIDKFIGDCIMAIFGAPITHENDPELALRAALEMNEKIVEFNNNLPVKLEKPLTLHTGINTGVVIAGDMGSDDRMDYTVMGDTVNLASRLESKAVNGQVFVSVYTYNQTKNLFEFVEHEPVTVKGKREPVKVYEVIRALEDSEIKGGSSVDIPLIGRSAEIDMLTDTVGRLKSGEGQAIFLVSDPGFGKSRVHTELRNKFRDGDLQFIEGRCHSYGSNTPYHTFIDLFKHLCAIDSSDMLEIMTQKFVEAMPLLLGEDIDMLSDMAKNSLVLIGKLLDLDLSNRYEVPLSEMSPQELNVATIKAIAWTFAAFAKHSPIIISIEDLHNADAASIEVISSLLHTASELPIMLLLMLRPNKNLSSAKLLPLARRLLGDRTIEVNFERLTRSDCEEFAKSILKVDELPKDLLELIGTRSDGNPLFLQEIIRSLVDEEIIKVTENGVEIVKKLSEVSIPNSITGLIIARFDKLSAKERELISKASVIGPSFSRKLIENLVDDVDIDSQIERLLKAEMIFESQSFPEVEYSFHTTFIQEAIYETLLLKRRRALHLDVATTMQNIYEDRLQDYVESLAHHYMEANDMLNAYNFLVLSAQKAKRAFANEIARDFFNDAIAIAKDLKDVEPKLKTVYAELSETQELLGDMSGAIKAWEFIVESADNELERANAMRNIGRIEEKRGSKEVAIDFYENALELLKSKTDTIEYAHLLMNLSWVLNRLRRTDEALEKALEALALFEKKSSKEHIALCCNNIAVFYENKGELDTALEYNLRSLDLFKELKNRRQIGNVELSLGYLHSKRGEIEMALDDFIHSADAMERIGNLVGTSTALLAKGRSYSDMGRNEEAQIALMAAMNNFKEMQMDRRVVATMISLINVLLDNNNTKDAFVHMLEAESLAKENNFESDRAKILRLYGRAYKIDGNEKESNKMYKASYELFSELKRERDAEAVKKEWKGK